MDIRNMSENLKIKIKQLVGDVSPDEENEVRAQFAWAEKKAKERGADAGLLEGIKTLFRMLTDPDYVVSWEVKSWILAGLVYFISPIDAIPDAIPVVGYLDDAAVVAWILHQLADEVVKYRKLLRRSSK